MAPDSAQHVLLLDESVVQQPVLPLDVSVIKQTVLPLGIFTIFYSRLCCLYSLDVSILQQPVLPLYVSSPTAACFAFGRVCLTAEVWQKSVKSWRATTFC